MDCILFWYDCVSAIFILYIHSIVLQYGNSCYTVSTIQMQPIKLNREAISERFYTWICNMASWSVCFKLITQVFNWCSLTARSHQKRRGDATPYKVNVRERRVTGRFFYFFRFFVVRKTCGTSWWMALHERPGTGERVEVEIFELCRGSRVMKANQCSLPEWSNVTAN